MEEDYYEEFLNKMAEYGTVRKPEFFQWYIKNLDNILRDAQHYKPKKEYKYMLTFTIDPKKHNPTEGLVQASIEKYIIKLLKDSKNSKFYFAKEHANSNCHWHCVIHRDTIFRQDIVRYYKQKYGHVDISRSHDLSDEHTEKYLSKESGTEIQRIL